MARFLVEQAPAVDGSRGRSNISTLRRKTMSERALISKREKAIKGLAELCVLRCIRPDHLIDSMDRFVYNVLDPNYFNYDKDIIEPLLKKKGKIPQNNEQSSISAVEFANKKLLG